MANGNAHSSRGPRECTGGEYAPRVPMVFPSLFASWASSVRFCETNSSRDQSTCRLISRTFRLRFLFFCCPPSPLRYFSPFQNSVVPLKRMPSWELPRPFVNLRRFVQPELNRLLSYPAYDLAALVSQPHHLSLQARSRSEF